MCTKPKERGIAMKQDLAAVLDARIQDAIELRRAIHARPELAFQEFNTTRLLRQALNGLDGVEFLKNPLETGLIVRVNGTKPGPSTLVRADIDALAMPEDSGLSFASQNQGICHACGHDIHAAVGVLLIWALCACRDRLSGQVTVVFQPAEEQASGAKALMENGLAQLVGPLDQILGFHTAPDLEAGRIRLISGPANASTDLVHIAVKGPGGHGAHPYRCTDPVTVAAYLICQLQTIISRENPAVEPAVLTFGQIAGGTAPNVIPTCVQMHGTLRAFYEEGRHKMWDAIRRIADGCCQSMRAQAEVTIEEGVPVMVNDPAICQKLADCAGRLLGEQGVFWKDLPSPGSDDFSCYLSMAPGAMFGIGTANDDPRSRYGIHNPQNLFDEASIRTGTAVCAAFLLGD